MPDLFQLIYKSFFLYIPRKDLFTLHGGARPSAKKILLVITDGQSHDWSLREKATADANAKNIRRFAIGVGLVCYPYYGIKISDIRTLNAK